LSFKQASQLENTYEGRSQILEESGKEIFKILHNSTTKFNTQNEGHPADKRKTSKHQETEKKKILAL